MNISYDSYRIFYYVAKYQSITHAAAALSGSQPNLTRTIKNLEESLGCKLFTRSRHGVQLTQEGQQLYQHISAAMEQIHAGETELLARQTLQHGMVTLAVSEIALQCCVLSALGKYRQRYPGVQVRLFSDSTPQAVTALRNSLVDMAVVTAPLTLPPSLSQQTIGTIQEIVIAGPMFDSLQEKRVSVEALCRYPLIGLGPNTGSHSFFSQLFAKAGQNYRLDIEVATALHILPMVASNLGLGFVPRQFLSRPFAESGCFPVDLQMDIPRRTLNLLRQKKAPLSAAAKELEKMIIAEAKAL